MRSPGFRWQSYFVLISLWTDPVYVGRRLSRALRRFRRRSPGGMPKCAPPSSSAAIARDARRLPQIDIDLVYLWVDGSDPSHRAKRNQWLQAYGLDPEVYNPDHRFVENDELRYSLRTAELFAPWVRRVFIVTDDQVPPWLDVTHPKLQIVDHREIAADPQWLPSFNSTAIEAQFHNIPGLSEHFIVCNDDMFFGQPCRPEDFFAIVPNSGGEAVGMKVMISQSDDDWIVPMHQMVDDPAGQLWMSEWNNHKAALELARPWRKVRRIDNHQAQSLTKSALEETVRLYPRDFRRTCAEKFRSFASLHFSRLTRYRCLANGTAVAGSIRHRVFTYETELEPLTQSDLPPLFCINDGPAGANITGERPLQRLFSSSSSFERATDASVPRGARRESEPSAPSEPDGERTVSEGVPR